ncbi:MAG: hypothetical protein SPI09_08095 [Candidatus Limivicinus sp.]|nr:flavodoxin domain-containing protein [Clostridiales bacterium]MCI7018415.1 flavodoxin domain-containing protein [Clostridiales bacterium]MCI7137489.1 flavodoxin domain-containing protein [Clostridiales bacterium]MDY6133304.1 hypothetical protein [Candidatus Limivicinus sp.]
MNANSIVYTSNTGYTAEYARLLGEKTGLPVYSLAKAEQKLAAGNRVIYLGWLMAGKVQGYKKAAKRYKVQAVCGVGMGGTGSQLQEVRKANAIPEKTPLFTLQGGFDIQKLSGVYKLMMTIMVKTAGKGLAEKQDRTPDEDVMLEMLTQGGSCVSADNLAEVLAWVEQG